MWLEDLNYYHFYFFTCHILFTVLLSLFSISNILTLQIKSGRVYVATEGVNAQMAVPTNVLKNFQEACESNYLFEDLLLNTDHFINKKEFEETKPFKSLHIR